MNSTKKIALGVIVLAFVVWGVLALSNPERASGELIRIGVITDLTGGAAYWGESTRAGAQIASDELREEGYNIELIFEDYGLEAPNAVSAAQKLVNINNVDAIYAEFNPAAISVGSFAQDKDILFVYDAAVTSPLEGNSNAFKTYLDYQAGCREIAKRFVSEGVEKLGVLQLNLEAGELCLRGVQEVYPPDALVVEAYNLGDTDFRTHLLKMNREGVGAVINAAFEGDTANTLRVIRDLGYSMRYGTVDDTISQEILNTYGEQLRGAWTFGFGEVDPDFSEKLASVDLGTEYGAAIAYTHIKQMVKALDACGKDVACAAERMSDSPSDKTIGFQGFSERIANLRMEIKQY